jgi:tripartite ATP-independent transporter DctP family solute receptor
LRQEGRGAPGPCPGAPRQWRPALLCLKYRLSAAADDDLIKDQRSKGRKDMTIRFTRRQALAMGASAVAGATMLGTGRALAQEVTIRIGHVLAPTHQFHQGLELAAASVAEATGGRVKVEVFPSSQLGTERDMNVSIRTGGVDGLLASPGGASVHLKELAILDAPYLFRDNAHWQAVVEGEIGEEWQRRIAEQSGVHIVGWFHRGTRHVISRTQPYETIEAIRGQKIRVADLPPYPQVFQAFGAIPTPIAFAEMYSALESGIVDGADAPLDTMLSQKLFEVAKFVNLISWSFAAPGPVMVSDAVWQQLSPEDQQALVAAVKEGSEFVTKTFTEGEESVKQQLTEAGMTFVTPTDLPAWEAAAAAAIPALAETWGGDVSLYDRIRNL